MKTSTEPLDLLRDALATARQNWWLFVDWLAVVEWKQLAILWLLVLIGFGLLNAPEAGVWFMLISFGVKVMGSGKRKAELEAAAADRKADVANLERRLTQAQMATLQAQVEPHFLFNTLALIGQLIETDPPEAARVHAHLIDYLRSSLPQMRAAGSATLGKQVELSRAYLAIMQARMKERLTVQFRVPDFLGSAPFPPMMLQTLIENAIKHGLEPNIAGGHITVSARVEEATLVVDVSDNGAGFHPTSDEGLGLANIHERLRLLFGRDAELVIESPAGGGTRASIRLPYQMMETS
ncbi:sensor histidine kinase [Massilia sp. DWR3-1-1]|uniref:sensor histidine kinase n=1 Tax=Massilia sp. DWR3-1-1 TaxID=2804559 RepID=UPI003CF6AB86